LSPLSGVPAGTLDLTRGCGFGFDDAAAGAVVLDVGFGVVGAGAGVGAEGEGAAAAPGAGAAFWFEELEDMYRCACPAVDGRVNSPRRGSREV
jgi:hypothetical protein